MLALLALSALAGLGHGQLCLSRDAMMEIVYPGSGRHWTRNKDAKINEASWTLNCPNNTAVHFEEQPHIVGKKTTTIFLAKCAPRERPLPASLFKWTYRQGHKDDTLPPSCREPAKCAEVTLAQGTIAETYITEERMIICDKDKYMLKPNATNVVKCMIPPKNETTPKFSGSPKDECKLKPAPKMCKRVDDEEGSIAGTQIKQEQAIQCNKSNGYEVKEGAKVKVKCQALGNFSKSPKDVCVKKCENVKTLQGTIEKTQTPNSQPIVCHDGYKLKDNVTKKAKCLDSGDFSESPENACEAKSVCPAVTEEEGTIANATCDIEQRRNAAERLLTPCHGADFQLNTTAIVECNDGYATNESAGAVICPATGKFSKSPKDVCKKKEFCDLTGANLSKTDGSDSKALSAMEITDTKTLHCLADEEFIGGRDTVKDANVTCKENKKLSITFAPGDVIDDVDANEICKKTEAPVVPVVPAVRCTAAATTKAKELNAEPNESKTVECQSGYVLKNKSENTVMCGPNGSFEQQPEDMCEKKKVIATGCTVAATTKAKALSAQPDESKTVECQSGYVLKNKSENTVMCGPNGSFEQQPEDMCEKKKVIATGCTVAATTKAKALSAQPDESKTVECQSGYELKNKSENTVMCGPNGSFDKQPETLCEISVPEICNLTGATPHERDSY